MTTATNDLVLRSLLPYEMTVEKDKYVTVTIDGELHTLHWVCIPFREEGVRRAIATRGGNSSIRYDSEDMRRALWEELAYAHRMEVDRPVPTYGHVHREGDQLILTILSPTAELHAYEGVGKYLGTQKSRAGILRGLAGKFATETARKAA